MKKEILPDPYCEDLGSTPCPEVGPILVTGATGYIGGRLMLELMTRGYSVRAMVRAASPEHESRWPGAEVVVADAADEPALQKALTGVHTAYYLIHSLLLGPKAFEERDLEYARNFRIAAERCGVKRIIYLGGLGDIRRGLSPHLESRAAVGKELRSSIVSLTTLRAAIIIGTGSASYEIIRHLVKNLPLILIPKWCRSKCQPIASRDVIRYLVGVLETPATSDLSMDIGGPDILTYEDMMRVVAGVTGYRRLFIKISSSNINFFAYFAGLLTPVPAPITRTLMAGLKNDVVCEDNRIHDLIPFRILTYREAIVDAMSREEQDRMYTRWTDSYPPAHELAIKLHELKNIPRYQSRYELITDKSAEAIFKSFCRIGGKEGWFRGNWMWRVRGLIDSICTGVGASRGRRSEVELRTNDVIDFWRVEKITSNERLLLRAEMLLPGKAWLEFLVKPRGDKRCLEVTAYFETNTLGGRIYWYMFVPFHFYIFYHLLRQIERRCP